MSNLFRQFEPCLKSIPNIFVSDTRVFSMDLEIKDNAALVTGSTSGLGKAVAESLGKEGVNVAINGRNREGVDETVSELRQICEGEIIGLARDLTNEDEVRSLVNETVNEFGGLDHLITSMGGPPSGAFEDVNTEDWYSAFDLLVMSVVHLVDESVEHLRESDGGTIVTVTSRSVKEAIDSLVLSNSVRMSVIGLEKTLSKELAPEIRANAVLPGPHETSRQQELIQATIEDGTFETYEDALAHRSENIPLNRLGDPEELGDVVAFLSSPRSSYINGAAVPIDGGLSGSNL